MSVKYFLTAAVFWFAFTVEAQKHGNEPERVVLPMSEVTTLPQFPGGEKALRRYLKENLDYPAEAWLYKIEGTVWVDFVVSTDGSLSNVQITRELGFGCGYEVRGLINDMPCWTPGKVGEAAVNTRMEVPVIFHMKDSR